MDTIKVRELPLKTSLALNDMIVAEDDDGTKTIPVSQFKSLLQQSIYFDTVHDMKNASLNEGDVVQTLGYRYPNDGGGATYKIVYAPTDLNDGSLVHYLHTSDTLRAHLIHNGVLNVMQAGAYGDGETDDYSFITKALETGLPLYFPKKVYKLESPLELVSGTVIDFNHSTFICKTAACISLGSNTDTDRVIIKNGTFIGKYGIEVYAYARNIDISGCRFISNDAIQMHKAITICGASNVKVMDCDIGSAEHEVQWGIFLSSGRRGATTYGNTNITLTVNRIVASKYGIHTTSTIKDKCIVISECDIDGYGDQSNVSAIGIMIGSNGEGVSITSCMMSNLETAVMVAGIVDVNVACSDIVCANTTCMYDILSDNAKLILVGIQSSLGRTPVDGIKPASYCFNRMTGTLYLDTVLLIDGFKTSLSGDLIDYQDAIGGRKQVIAKAADLNKISGTHNLAIDINYSSLITDFPHTALDGQILAVYSTVGATLQHNTNILLGEDTNLDRYIPVLLKKINGLWTRIG